MNSNDKIEALKRQIYNLTADMSTAVLDRQFDRARSNAREFMAVLEVYEQTVDGSDDSED